MSIHPAILKAREFAAKLGGKGSGRGGNAPTHDYEAIVRCFLKLDKANAVDKHLGLPLATASKVLRKCGIYIGAGQRAPKFDLPMDEIISRYMSGESTWELGPAYNVDPEVIRRRLRVAKVARRSLRDSRARGKKNSFYKHGRDHNPMHYFRRQSYEVAAICLGQPLPQGAVIHHVDENPENNSPTNLVVFSGQSDHARFHMLLLRLHRQGVEVDASRLALENGGKALPRPPSPILFQPCTIPRDRATRGHKPSLCPSGLGPMTKAIARQSEHPQ